MYHGLYQTYSGSSSISYANIAANYLKDPTYIRYFHADSMVPWLFNGTTFITYEDEQSMTLKAQYVVNKGLAGAMIWELSQDPDRVLLNALYNGLK
jgi:chitinase